MKSSNKSWPFAFWTILVLSVIEAGLFVRHGVILGVLPLSTSLLLLISLAPPTTPAEDSKKLFWRSAAGVVLVGVVFVNCTHALELLTEQINPTDNHHHGHDESGPIPVSYLITAVVDTVLKGFFVFSGQTPSFGYRHHGPTFVLLCTPAITVACVAGVSQFLHSDAWLWEHLVPVATLLLSATTVALIRPYFHQLKDYIFHSAPDTFDIDSLKRDLHIKIPQVQIRHCHVFRVWPRGATEAHFRLSIKVDKATDSWGREGKEIYDMAVLLIRDELGKNCGSGKVMIEPHFVNKGNPAAGVEKYPICVDKHCQSRRLTCCSPEETLENVSANA